MSSKRLRSPLFNPGSSIIHDERATLKRHVPPGRLPCDMSECYPLHRSKNGRFAEDGIYDPNLLTEKDLDVFISYSEQFADHECCFLGDGNLRNGRPFFGHGRS